MVRLACGGRAQRTPAEQTLGLRRAYLPRAGYAFVAGFPMPLACCWAIVDVTARSSRNVFVRFLIQPVSIS